MLSFTDTVNPGKLLPQLDGEVSTHCIADSLDQLEFRAQSTGEMFGPDKYSEDDKGQVVSRPLDKASQCAEQQ